MGHCCGCCKKRAFKVTEKGLSTFLTGREFIPSQTHRDSSGPTLNSKTQIQCVPRMNESLFLGYFVIQVPKPRKSLPPHHPFSIHTLQRKGLKLISVWNWAKWSQIKDALSLAVTPMLKKIMGLIPQSESTAMPKAAAPAVCCSGGEAAVVIMHALTLGWGSSWPATHPYSRGPGAECSLWPLHSLIEVVKWHQIWA